MEGHSPSHILKTEEIKTEDDEDSPTDFLKIKIEDDAGYDEVDCMVAAHDDNSATGPSPNIESWPGDKKFRYIDNSF